MRNIVTKINIPFTKQKTDYFCGPASLQMVFSYFNFDAEQYDLADKMKTDNEFGTKKKKMIDIVRKNGFHYCAKENSKIQDIEELVRNKIPVVVNFIEPSEEESHYAVVVGTSRHEIIFSDPWNGDNFKILKKEFLKRWYGFEDKRNRWMLAIYNAPFCGCSCVSE